ncbi:hypothetical protein SAMN05192560_1485 [Methylobacillus rhizosphaerae]|uniref:Uncharacterized protein n=1 Tax=Methylobacillus rhizosphaerae TaxID=551994 RepID=A0A238ZRV5_9PROT|nr:hypothetical protein [Methylobacillus rhizosphaerae]SNR86156.1 hypothetical protein SAMN05192560_1485 [Methylobacillus rhizosphaerae]
MFANSVVLITLTLVIGLPPLVCLFMALSAGQLDDGGSSAESIFEEQELRYSRPWETRRQMQDRVQQHGNLMNNPRAEWERWL